MAEVTREVVHDRRGGSGFVAWLALVLAILALAIAWMAYNRAGEDLENRIQTQVDQVLEEADRQTPDVDVDIDPPEAQQESNQDNTRDDAASPDTTDE